VTRNGTNDSARATKCDTVLYPLPQTVRSPASTAKRSATLNKPVYAGVQTLHTSKVLVYGSRVRLLCTDTDSLTYQVECEDHLTGVNENFKSDFDFSDTPKDHFLYDTTNKKVRGKSSFRRNVRWFESFVGAVEGAPTLLGDNDEEKSTAKGVNKHERRHVLRHYHYKQANTSQLWCKVGVRLELLVSNTRSHNQQVYQEQCKEAASKLQQEVPT
jgi:hypothetical protein